MNTILKVSALTLVTVLAAGCSSNTEDRINAADNAAQQANSTAQQAQQTAEQALSAAQQAQASADKANETAARMLNVKTRK